MPCPRQSTASLLGQCLCRHSAFADLTKPMHRYRYPIPLRRCPQAYPLPVLASPVPNTACAVNVLASQCLGQSMPLLVSPFTSLCHASANTDQRPCLSLPTRRLALRYHCSTDPWQYRSVPIQNNALPVLRLHHAPPCLCLALPIPSTAQPQRCLAKARLLFATAIPSLRFTMPLPCYAIVVPGHPRTLQCPRISSPMLCHAYAVRRSAMPAP